MRIITWLSGVLKIYKIRSQLIFSIAAVHLVLMSIFVFDMVERQRQFLLQQGQSQVLSLANELAVNASNYIMTNDLDGLERLVQSHTNFPYLKYSMILSSQGTVLAHTQAKYVGQVPVDSVSRTLTIQANPQTLFENKEMLDIAVPIKFGVNTIGVARIGFSKEHINATLRDIMDDGVWYIVIALLVGIVIAIIMGRWLSIGLYKLVTTANKIRLGDRDMRAGALNSYELQTLGIALNQMIDEISANENLLKNVLESLPVGVWILDKNANVKSVNAAGKELWGGAKYVGVDGYGEYKGWFIDTGKLVEPEQWGAAIALKEGRAVLNQEMEIETFDQSRKIILNSAIPLKNVYGEQEGLITINVDITQRKLAEIALKKTNQNIGERIKELNCLYRISELSHNQDKKIEEILQDCVAIIPPAYQYPHITCARITYLGQQYQSPGVFEESVWQQTADIKVADTVVGQLEVFYTKQSPQEDEGPFLKEERLLINSFTDILGGALERKKTEFAVREAELKFRNLVEKSLVGVYILQNNKFVYVNPQIVADSGFSEAELFEKSIYDIILDDDWPVVKSNITKRQSGETESVQYEVRAQAKDGKVIWLEIFGTITIYNGAHAMIGTMVNITERKAVYDSLKKSEARLKSIFDTTDVSYLLLDKNYNIISLNQHMKDAYIAAADVVLYEGADLMKLMPPEKRERAKAIYDNVIESNSAFNYETIYVNNGVSTHLWANVKPINDGKNVIGVCISSIDITERQQALEQLKKLNENLQKKAEELAVSNTELADSKKMYSNLFNFSPLPAWVADVNTLRFLDVNNAAVQHYGYSREEFLSMSLKEIRPEEDIPQMHNAVAERLNQKGGIYRVVLTHKKKNGELMNVDIQVAPIQYSGVKANIAIATDITERQNYIKAIEAQNKRLLDISWIQSHIARAPLSRIMGLIPMLESANDTEEERKVILDYILASAHELDEVIKTITDKSKIEDFQLLKLDGERDGS
jgi:PAS domain S-box-containing protein